ncbi:hypothetical protein EVAR_23496_1 [Eumeta japonica]|uniref:Uncharacterized protein n=1 Tax=Eumeta variegata TaxID=151549 RepID=A0A4C1W1S6_EUMVA|nr:hypothetical protein EVAR_23496_1 [Eumeta japonica]
MITGDRRDSRNCTEQANGAAGSDCIGAGAGCVSPLSKRATKSARPAAPAHAATAPPRAYSAARAQPTARSAISRSPAPLGSSPQIIGCSIPARDSSVIEISYTEYRT